MLMKCGVCGLSERRRIFKQRVCHPFSSSANFIRALYAAPDPDEAATAPDGPEPTPSNSTSAASPSRNTTLESPTPIPMS